MSIDTEESKPTKGKGGGGNKKVLIIVLSVVGGLLLLGILATAAVGYFFKEAVETGIESTTGTNFDINSDGSEFEIKGQDGESSIKVDASDPELPENFPDYVPLYPGAELTTASSFTQSDSGEMYTAAFSTADSSKQVFEFYKNKLTAAEGFEVKSTRQTTNGFSWVKAIHEADQKFVSVSILRDDGSNSDTTIQISISKINN